MEMGSCDVPQHADEDCAIFCATGIWCSTTASIAFIVIFALVLFFWKEKDIQRASALLRYMWPQAAMVLCINVVITASTSTHYKTTSREELRDETRNRAPINDMIAAV